MACRFVSGVIALLLSKRPSLTPKMVRDILVAQAMDIGEKSWDPYFGYGIPDAYMVVTETPIPEITKMSILLLASTVILFVVIGDRKTRERPPGYRRATRRNLNEITSVWCGAGSILVSPNH